MYCNMLRTYLTCKYVYKDVFKNYNGNIKSISVLLVSVKQACFTNCQKLLGFEIQNT